MIDLASVITTGGVILFYKVFDIIKEDILSKVVDGIVTQRQFIKVNTTKVQWLLLNELGLVLIVAYQESFGILYIDVLLNMMKEQFLKVHQQSIKQNGIYKLIPNFENDFEQVMNAWQSYCDIKQDRKHDNQQNQLKIPVKENQDTSEKADIKDIIARKKGQKSPPSEAKSPEAKSPQNQKQKVIMSDKLKKNAKEELDYTKKQTQQQYQPNLNQYLDDPSDKLLDQFLSSDDELSEEENTQKQKKLNIFSKLTSGIQNLTGNKQLSEEDLLPVLDQFKQTLMIKNVAEEIAQKLCDSLKVRLLNAKTKAFTSVQKTVRECLKENLIKILTPNRNIDIISEALKCREKQKPYVVVFIGVNGVGKSTNLAKVAYLFKSQGFSVMIAACDNFRAGAVEQVKQHGQCLGIPVFDKGYKDEPPEIAYQAIREATLKKIDVVLVDTAGRMQNNEPLMRALSRIVSMNNPDLVVFIGEALVGNDGVDQLMSFNKALVVNSNKDNIREIDAIIVSKFDTVDEKVGAALSLTYATGKPILFVGIGQKYTHLRKLNVNTVVQALLQ
ncbi:hypothetical protein pb186bvf_017848 [Paramecium bursaria]